MMTKRKRMSGLVFTLLLPLRVAGLLAILAALLVAGAAILVRVMLTPEQLASLISSQLQEVLHRPVQVGDVQVLPLQGIRIRDLRVLEAPGFPGTEFLSSEIAVAKYRWRPLLQRRLEFSEVRLVGPRIQIVRRQDGAWNLEGLFQRRSEPAKPLSIPLPVSLAADVVAIENAQVSVRDLARQRSVSVRGFNMEVRGFSTTEPFPFELSLETDANFGGKQARVKGSAKGSLSLAGFEWAKGWLEVSRIRLSIDGEAVSASGSLRDFLKPTVDLKLKLPRLTSENLGRYAQVPAGLSIPSGLARLRFSMPSPTSFRVLAAEVEADPLRLSATGSLTLGAKPSYRWNATMPASSLERVAGLWAGLASRKLSGTGDCAATVSGTLGPEGRPVVEKLALHLKDFNMVLSSNAAISKADITVEGSRNLEELQLVAPRGRVVAYGNAFSDINLSMKLADGDLDIEKLELTWSISHAKLKGRVRNLSAPKGVDVEGSIDKLVLPDAIAATAAIVSQIKASQPKEPETPKPERKWSQVFKYAIPKSFPATNGSLRIAELSQPDFNTFNVDLKWGLRGISTGLDKVSGWVRTGFGPGRVSNIPQLEKAHTILRVIFLPFVFMQKMNNAAGGAFETIYPKTLDFTKIYGQYALQEGVVDITPFHVDSGVLVGCAEGKVDFPKEKVGLHVLTRLTSSRAPLPQYLSDEKGRPSIGFYVRGDLNKPDAELDMHKMSATAIEDCLQEGLKRGQALSQQ